MLWQQLRGIAIALLLVAATTVVALLLREYLGILRGSVLYLVPVMLAGYHFGVVPALVTAVAGVILSGYLYFAQLYSFRSPRRRRRSTSCCSWWWRWWCRTSPTRPSGTPRSRASASRR